MSNDERDDRDDADPGDTESGDADDGSDDNWVGDSVDEDAGGTADRDTGGPTASSSASGQKGPDEKYCAECGAVINEKAEICPECGVRQPGMESGNDERIVAALLAILLGSFGAHKFYLGNTKLGIVYLCFFWTGIPGIIGIVEGVIYLTKNDDEFRRQYVDE
ncbi:NINE protein [Halosimplex litoreum]|uniref:NINE protein n=1 Tax=Halosimplex litoreum TaxID=1198301 RepID=A0A7T3FVD3_9EURY|nr:NINE protein [Halosimplex litoreum]QPV61370.1 NINE protein [Halosimplex litoreum]